MSPTSLFSPALPAGTFLDEGKFCLEGEIGRGGFGITYRARRIEDQTPVAIKECFLPVCARDGARVVAPDEDARRALASWNERMLEHAEHLRQVLHPHLARVFGAWRENNTVYLEMELLEGPTLAEHIEANGALSPDEALERAHELASALEELHERGLLHLDVKPENAVWTERGAVLMDFDLVAPVGDTDLRTRPLSLVQRVGTPGYAPPEAYGQRAPHTPASDVYSLGATFYFLLSSQTPPSAVDRAAGVELAPIAPGLAAHLRDALDAALQLPIGERPVSVAHFRALWTPPPAPLAPADDYSVSAHQANLAQSQLKSGVYRVVLTHSEAEFPPRCVCCFQKADAQMPVNSPSGRRFVPGCALCVRHQSMARASGSWTFIGIGLAVLLSAAGAGLSVIIDNPAPLALCLLALLVCFGAMNYGALKNSRAEELLKSSCCDIIEPVTYNFNGRVYIWRFKNVFYAQEFKKKNASFVV